MQIAPARILIPDLWAIVPDRSQKDTGGRRERKSGSTADEEGAAGCCRRGGELGALDCLRSWHCQDGSPRARNSQNSDPQVVFLSVNFRDNLDADPNLEVKMSPPLWSHILLFDPPAKYFAI